MITERDEAGRIMREKTIIVRKRAVRRWTRNVEDMDVCGRSMSSLEWKTWNGWEGTIL